MDKNGGSIKIQMIKFLGFASSISRIEIIFFVVYHLWVIFKDNINGQQYVNIFILENDNSGDKKSVQ